MDLPPQLGHEGGWQGNDPTISVFGASNGEPASVKVDILNARRIKHGDPFQVSLA
jgi:hypothetical protein